MQTFAVVRVIVSDHNFHAVLGLHNNAMYNSPIRVLAFRVLPNALSSDGQHLEFTLLDERRLTLGQAVQGEAFRLQLRLHAWQARCAALLKANHGVCCRQGSRVDLKLLLHGIVPSVASNIEGAQGELRHRRYAVQQWQGAIVALRFGKSQPRGRARKMGSMVDG